MSEKITMPLAGVTEKLLLNIHEVAHMTGMGERTIYRLMKREKFPKPKELPGVRGHRWTRGSVEKWAERLPVNAEAGCE